MSQGILVIILVPCALFNCAGKALKKISITRIMTSEGSNNLAISRYDSAKLDYAFIHVSFRKSEAIFIHCKSIADPLRVGERTDVLI